MTKLLANTVNFMLNEVKKLEGRQSELSIEQANAEGAINYLKKCLKSAEKSEVAKLPMTVLSTLRTELGKSEERRDAAKADLQEFDEAISFLKKTLKGVSKNDA